MSPLVAGLSTMWFTTNSAPTQSGTQKARTEFHAIARSMTKPSLWTTRTPALHQGVLCHQTVVRAPVACRILEDVGHAASAREVTMCCDGVVIR
ncbi:conserved hypothetical protein [Verticillium alfalfae VaMs.102]|uniref:Uncharacterized protein n=1 Tax=Verticillium alfalfae (strain VaMs.102 / ATCC MYA-4576 / FGSC 10136) TaxID=526221 RepID=C9SVZ0_VERA1|nr:conserved hypothetical protein [Verticillium alfalfae VaMs.102]EEY22955.1 conserved hypothetical protein [Verticillium alfalfae VaMs.102]